MFKVSVVQVKQEQVQREPAYVYMCVCVSAHRDGQASDFCVNTLHCPNQGGLARLRETEVYKII